MQTTVVTDDVTFVYFISILSEILFIEGFIKVVIIMFLLFYVPHDARSGGTAPKRRLAAPAPHRSPLAWFI